MKAEILKLVSKFENSVEQLKERNNQFIGEFRREREQRVEQLQLETQTNTLDCSAGLQAGTSKLSR
jgi:predicted enzyme involved in methoxymalonyl-ACP biosynthesis